MTPYSLMFGREPRLPVDIMFGLETSESRSQCTTKYVKVLKERMRNAYKLATGI